MVGSLGGWSGSLTTGKISRHFQKCLNFSKRITWKFEDLSNFLRFECPNLARALTYTDQEKIGCVCVCWVVVVNVFIFHEDNIYEQSWSSFFFFYLCLVNILMILEMLSLLSVFLGLLLAVPNLAAHQNDRRCLLDTQNAPPASGDSDEAELGRRSQMDGSGRHHR